MDFITETQYRQEISDLWARVNQCKPQLAALQADRDFWKLSFEAADMAVQEEREELKKVYTENERLRKIEARYNFIRSGEVYIEPNWIDETDSGGKNLLDSIYVCVDIGRPEYTRTPEAFDAAIDEAMEDNT